MEQDPALTALRCRRPHRPTHRRSASGSAFHDLRPPQQNKHRTTAHRQHRWPGVTAAPTSLSVRPVAYLPGRLLPGPDRLSVTFPSIGPQAPVKRESQVPSSGGDPGFNFPTPQQEVG